MQVISAIAIIVILIVAGMMLFSPKGDEIIFIAPDDNGIDNIWIADLNDPENPRQLSFHDTTLMSYIELSDTDRLVFYPVVAENAVVSSAPFSEIRMLNIDSQQEEIIFTCVEGSHCHHFHIHHEGVWFSYLERIDETGYVRVYNRLTQENRILETIENLTSASVNNGKIVPRWVGQTDLLSFAMDDGEQEDTKMIQFYGIETDDSYELSLSIAGTTAFFSPDGSRYASSYFADSQPAVHINNIESGDRISLPEINETDDAFLFHALFRAWHPDNLSILIEERWIRGDEELAELALYDLTTASKRTLTSSEFNIINLNFNQDGSKLVYTIFDWQADSKQIVLYDMETQEETALPLFGHHAQWVNSGR